MTDKEKIIANLHKALDSLDITSDLRLVLIQTIEYLQEEPVSENLEAELNKYIKDNFTIDKEQLDRFNIEEKDYMYSMDKSDILTMVSFFTNLQKEKDTKIIIDVEAVSFANGMAQMKKQIEESVSEELEKAAKHYLYSNILYDDVYVGNPTDKDCIEMFKAGAKWQEKQDQSTIELAEDHAYFAGKTKTIDEIKEALLSEVMPCFMHGGEADEVVAKLDEVLNQKR